MPLVFENQKSDTSIQNPKLEIKNRPQVTKIKDWPPVSKMQKVQSASSHHTFLDYKKCPRDKK